MKGIFTAAAAVLLALSISNSVLAHSHLGGSNPADGDIVSEPLNEIRLEFEGQMNKSRLNSLSAGKVSCDYKFKAAMK